MQFLALSAYYTLFNYALEIPWIMHNMNIADVKYSKDPLHL